MDRYIGLDAHSSSCTVAVVSPSGRRLQSKVLETNARVLIDFLKSIPRSRHLCLEEGTHSAWLYEELTPHVDELVVVGVGRRQGSKSDSVDAFGLAEALRVGSIERRVYKGLGEWGTLRELSRAYRMVVSDSVRVQCRIKSLFRSRGIATGGAKGTGSLFARSGRRSSRWPCTHWSRSSTRNSTRSESFSSGPRRRCWRNRTGMGFLGSWRLAPALCANIQ